MIRLENREAMKNLAHEYALSIGLTVEQAQKDWDGACIEFAGDFVDSEMGNLAKARMAYFDTPHNPFVKYHCTIEVGTYIHDLWMDEPVPLDEYIHLVGAETVEYPAECEDSI